MPEFRTFRNTDPPHLAAIWRSQPPQRGVVQPMTAELLEESVFSKQSFDPSGLIVATLGDQPIGFAHAGFGPDDAGSRIDTSLGTTHQVLVHTDHADASLEDALLKRSEDYLASRGATVRYGGGIRPLDGFYLGLYGGSESPGVLDSDAKQLAIFTRAGYETIDRVVVLQCDLSFFRPPISRAFRESSRRYRSVAIPDPEARTWWEACASSGFDQVAYQLVDRTDDDSVFANATLRYMAPLSATWGVKAAGLDHLQVIADHRRRGMATCLLASIFSDLHEQGIAIVEAQTMQHNAPALALYQKLGFVEIERGSVLRKTASNA